MPTVQKGYPPGPPKPQIDANIEYTTTAQDRNDAFNTLSTQFTDVKTQTHTHTHTNTHTHIHTHIHTHTHTCAAAAAAAALAAAAPTVAAAAVANNLRRTW